MTDNSADSGRRWLVGAILSLFVSVAPFPVDAGARTITIAAAASLTEVVEALGLAFRDKTGVEVRASFSSSAVAARQVIGGAPFDVFLSANAAWLDETISRGALIEDSVRHLAGNTLVVAVNGSVEIVPGVDAKRLIEDAVAAKWRIAIADPDSVPAGIYAAEALQGLGLWQAVRPLLTPLQNVRTVVAFIARGDTPIGFAYATDLRVADTVRGVSVLDPALHSPIVYAGGRTAQSAFPSEADAFLEFAASPAGQAIFQAFGFTMPPSGNRG